MSCIGIDIGQQNAGAPRPARPGAPFRVADHSPHHPVRALVPAVVAIARRGGIDVLTNEVSKRLTACMVGFSGKERKLGEAALSGVRALPPPAAHPAASRASQPVACSAPPPTRRNRASLCRCAV